MALERPRPERRRRDYLRIQCQALSAEFIHGTSDAGHDLGSRRSPEAPPDSQGRQRAPFGLARFPRRQARPGRKPRRHLVAARQERRAAEPDPHERLRRTRAVLESGRQMDYLLLRRIRGERACVTGRRRAGQAGNRHVHGRRISLSTPLVARFQMDAAGRSRNQILRVQRRAAEGALLRPH